MESWSRGGASLVSGLPPSPPQLGPGSWAAALCCRGMTGKREERGASRGGGWLRVPGCGWWVRGSPAQTGPKPLGPLGHTGCWWSLLRVQDREAQDLFEHLLGTHLGLAWAGG